MHNIQGFFMKLRGIIVFMCCFILFFSAPKDAYAQTETGRFVFEGRNRGYIVFLPQNFQSNMPVVFNLHGWTDNCQWQMNYSRMNDVADTAGFIIVYPDAIYPGFNTGLVASGWPPLPTYVDDVGFISTLIDTMQAHYNIDMNRIYCCGFSNGGYMTYKLAGELGYRFAAMASVAGLISDKMAITCKPVRSFPILHIHGTKDSNVKWNGSNLNTWSVEKTINFWAQQNNCILPPDSILLPDIDSTDYCTVEKISYTNCSDEASVILYKVIKGGHSWPGSNPDISWGSEGLVNRDINANVEIWNFFKNYENPLVILAFEKKIEVVPMYFSPEEDTLIVNAILNNPENHSVTIKAFIKGTQSTFSDSLELFDDGLHSDGNSYDNIWSGMRWLSGIDEDIYEVTLRTTDLELDITTNSHYPSRFTTIGPIQMADQPYIDHTYNENVKRQMIYLVIQNNGKEMAAENLEVRLSTLDQRINIISDRRLFDDCKPGLKVTGSHFYAFDYADGYGPESTVDNPIHFDVTIFSDDFLPYWTDSFYYVSTLVGIEDKVLINVPKEFVLFQNYPNPFNPATTINYQLQITSEVELSIYNMMGQKILTLVSENQPAGTYKKNI